MKKPLASCAVAGVVFALYLVSAGPAAFYVARHHTAKNMARVTTIYRPVIGIPLLQKYTRLWIGLADRFPALHKLDEKTAG